MKEHFRQSMSWLHTWAGLVVGWLLFFIFLMGTGAYFKDEITRWMQPERPLRAALDPTRSLPSAAAMAEMALDHLARQPGSSEGWWITLPNDGHRAGNNDHRGDQRGLMVQSDTLGEVELDPLTGQELAPIQVRETEGGEFFRSLHYELHYIDTGTGEYITGACAMLMLLACITGVIVHKKIFVDFFTFRPGKGQRSWLDAHNVISVMALPFFLMISYSGLMLLNSTYMPIPEWAIYGSERADHLRFNAELLDRQDHVPVSRPTVPMARIMDQAEAVLGAGEATSISVTRVKGEALEVFVSRDWGTELPITNNELTKLRFDATTGERLPYAGDGMGLRGTRWMAALHFGWFANPAFRWLYIVCGLMGGAMIAAGLVLWTVKRRGRHAGAFVGLRLVEWLNVLTIVGLPIAVAAYFWANRLLPVEMADRAEWEQDLFFLAWLWTAFYALLRPLKSAWYELLLIAAGGFTLVPVINALSTARHLGITLPAGDWVLAGFDLTMLGLGALFAAAAVKLRRQWGHAGSAGRPSKHRREAAAQASELTT